MGEAYAAWADDAYGMYFNPAGIARVSRQELGLLHNTLYEDLSYSYAGYLLPMGRGTWALSGLFVDLGSVDRTTVASGAQNVVIGRADGSDLAVSLTYAHAVLRTLDLGMTVKVIHEKLDRFSATAGAVDLGLKWHQPLPGLTFGLSISNLGSRLQFVRQSEELPIALRLGLGYRSPSGLWGLVSDVVWVKDQDVEAKFGGELWVWPRHLALRVGVNSANDVARTGITAGAAFQWEDLAVDYAYVPYGELGNQNLVSLTYRFGSERPREEERMEERPRVAEAARHEEPRRNPPPPVEVTVIEAPPVPAPVETPRVEMPRVEMPRVETPRVVVEGGLYVAPFRFEGGSERYDWMSMGTAEIFRQDWGVAGLVEDPAGALFILDGAYRVENGRIYITAQLIRGASVVETFAAEGDVERPFPAWDRLLVSVNRALERWGRAGVSIQEPVDRGRFSRP